MEHQRIFGKVLSFTSGSAAWGACNGQDFEGQDYNLKMRRGFGAAEARHPHKSEDEGKLWIRNSIA